MSRQNLFIRLNKTYLFNLILIVCRFLAMNSNILNNSVDKTQIPPLHQKRILAFVNHFVISSCSFLNDFASQCETKFIEVERKIQKVEASLIIIEAKLSSIPDLNDSNKKAEPLLNQEITKDQGNDEVDPTTETKGEEATVTEEPLIQETGVKACDDIRYKKFFKMIQFGVPINAVKLKMQAERVDPAIIDTPNIILTDGIIS